MAEFNWTAYGSIATYETTDLNSLANDANVIGAAIDNSSNLDFYISIEIYLASVDLSAQTGPAVYLWIIHDTDETNFEDGAAAVDPARMPDAIIALREVSGVQRVHAFGIPIPPENFKILIGNRAGAAWAATLNTCKYRVFSEKSV